VPSFHLGILFVYSLWSDSKAVSQSTIMPRGRLVVEDLRWTIVRMAPFVKMEHISAWTGVSRSKILEILALFRRTGQVMTATDHHHRGRHRHLTSDDVAVSFFLTISV
jgi:hypothetical protein